MVNVSKAPLKPKLWNTKLEMLCLFQWAVFIACIIFGKVRFKTEFLMAQPQLSFPHTNCHLPLYNPGNSFGELFNMV